MSRLPFFALASVFWCLSFTPLSYADPVTYSVASVDENFATGGFSLLGTTNFTVTLTPGVPQTVNLDRNGNFLGTTAAMQTFTGTAASDVTLNGVTESVSDAFSYTTGFLTRSLSFTGGDPVIFDLGIFDVTVTPINSSNVRQATFLETPATTSVPEPASLVLLGSALLGLGVMRRRRRSS